MKDYFRRERISFKYNPILWLARLLFVFLMIVAGRMQWFIILFGSAFSVGFVQATEMEHMLPLSEKEVIGKKKMKIRNVWLRYLLIGMVGRVYIYFAGKNGWYGFHDHVSRKLLLIEAAFFILLMVYAYELMLDAISEARENGGVRTLLPRAVYKIFIQTIPHVIFFTYAIVIMMSAQKAKGLLKEGPQWMHAAILLGAAVLLVINVLIERSKLGTYDYRPAEE
jgi:hypothetical protein